MKNLCLTVVALVLTACSSTSAQQSKRPAQHVQGEVVATVGAVNVTLSEIDEKAMQQPVNSFGSMKLSQALYEARRVALDEVIANKLMDDAAKAQGIDRSALIEKEITAKITPVTDADVQGWYVANQQRVQGAPLEQVRQPIRSYLTQQRMQTVRDAYVDSLKAKTRVTLMLDPPRQTVAAGNSPAKGSPNAPVEIIEFSDFQCPFCLRANPTVTQVLSTYGDRIHFVYRHYPLPNHPNARPAAEAAACAAEQGKFWQYHDALFANPAQLSENDLKAHAATIGLDTTKFNTCVDTHATKQIVETDAEAGADAGVDGTPAFFINGRMISGAQPFDVFKKMIDEELQSTGR